MMRKLLFACGLVMSMTLIQVSALDNCFPTGYDPCCADFNGFYIGGNIGVLSHTAHREDVDGFLFSPTGWNTVDTKFMGGFQFGYDWQCDNTLFGLVADWNWTSVDKRVNVADPEDGPALIETSFRSTLNWFSTIRFRAGITLCDALFYITGGAAHAEFKTLWIQDTTADHKFSFPDDRTKWGWTAGAGTEFLLGCNWSLGAEVLYLQFAQHSSSFAANASVVTFGSSDSLWIGRIMLNYRFGDLL